MSSCSLCSSPFETTPQDLQFYEAVSPMFNGKAYAFPPPTLCPQCRNQRRMAWRNDRTFYRRICDATGEAFISMYPQDTAFPVYKQDAWHGDGWDAESFGRTFDFSRPFFEQWVELRDQVPHWGVAISNCQNSDYCNFCTDEKNCYLDIAAEANEDCYYNLFTKYSKNCCDCTFVYRSQLLYECIHCYDSYNCRYGMYLDNCSDCTFCFDCKGCKNCLLSTNLRNKEYYILNQPHTKEKYQQKLQELNVGSYQSNLQVQQFWQQKRIEMGIYRDMYTINSQQCLGNNIHNSKNCQFVFNVVDCEDSRYLYDVIEAKDCMDMNYSVYKPEMSYELMSTAGARFCTFYTMGPYNTNCHYSQMCKSCTNCFGCCGLKNKEYCILNKQYSKEEYEALVPRLIEQMRNTGEYGEFFPVELSPWGYNETVAQEYMPLTEDIVKQRRWKWSEKQENDQISISNAQTDIPDNILDADDSIRTQAFSCAATGKPFKLIPQELAFYKQMNVPLPRFCPDERHRQRIAKRNPRTLWQRQCSESGNTIWTSFSPEKSEKVVCEEVYLEKVY